jgi:hypothetical protein
MIVTTLRASLLCSLTFFACLTAARAADVAVATAAELRAAVAAAVPGTRVLLAGGVYGGGFHFKNLRGEPGRPIVLAAADPKNAPVFSGAKTGLHLSNPAWVELHDLAFDKLSDNGLNVDDGAPAAGTDGSTRAHHVTLRRLRVTDVGTTGNQDGIKLSGLWDFRVEGCTIERWGRGGGSAIDLVGCHRGEITGNTIRHETPEPGNCTGVQAKGGSSEIAVTRNRFEHAGGRAVNIGGSTGRPFFRPTLAGAGPHAEARAIRVEGNTFVGGVTPMAFVGVDGAVVRFNTIENPARWALRILQENRALDFIACRAGVFTDNVVIFESARWSEGGVNLGSGTAPDTFIFARNWWWCRDRPDRSTPRLPTPETEGVYGRDPAEARGKAGAEAWPTAAAGR